MSLKWKKCLNRRGEFMSNKRKIEVFSAGCPACDEAIEIVNRIACSSCDIEVLDMHQPNVAARAQQLGINTVPAIVIDGMIAECCAADGLNGRVLRAGGVGV